MNTIHQPQTKAQAASPAANSGAATSGAATSGSKSARFAIANDAGVDGLAVELAESLVDAREFRDLMVSHRRMVRADRAEDLLKGLRDLDTGELFLVAERQLLDTPN